MTTTDTAGIPMDGANPATCDDCDCCWLYECQRGCDAVTLCPCAVVDSGDQP